jgi:molecular chaperone HscB
MICWSCERAVGEGGTCVHCGALQPPQAHADHFSVLGVARRYDLDLDQLEGRFRSLSRQLHPDRFARADQRERRASLQRTVQLNEAWRTLKDPIKRAEYMLRLAGMPVGGEEGDGGKVPAPLLMEILELREALAEARLAKDHRKVAAMAADMSARAAETLGAVAEALGRGTAADLARAGRELVALRYYQRFLDEVAVHEDGVAADKESSHAG